MHEGIPMASRNRASNLITTAFALLDTLSTTPVESISNLHFVIEFERLICQFFTHSLSISYTSIDAQSVPEWRVVAYFGRTCDVAQAWRHAEYRHRCKGHSPRIFRPCHRSQMIGAEGSDQAADSAAQGDAKMQYAPRYAWQCHAPSSC
jgi:hypothetical protein